MLEYLFQQWTQERNCWWLVRDYYANQLGITLPQYPWNGTKAAQVRDVSQKLADSAEGWQQIEQPESNCLVAMGRGGVVYHVGVWLAGDKKVLHICEGYTGRADPLDRLALIHDTIRFYRYDSANS